MSTRTRAATLAPGLLLALLFCAGEAAAQNVCRGGSYTGGGIITCMEGAGSSADILVDPGKLGINHPTANTVAVEGDHSGSGGVELRMTAGSIVTTGTAGHGLYARHAGATGGGAVVVRMSGGSVETRGSNAYAIWARRASGTGNVRIDVTGGSLSRTGATGGVVLGHHQGTGNITIDMSGGAIEATGAGVRGLTGTHRGTGDLTIGLTGGSIATTGIGIGATRSNAVTAGNVAVTVSHASSAVRTTGALGHGVSIVNIAGAATITMHDGLVETTGAGALGLHADSYSDTESSPGTTSIVLEGGTVRTRGGIHTFSNVNYYSHGIRAQSNYTRGDVSVRMTGGAVETAGAGAYGIFVVKGGLAGAGSIEMTGGAITVAGDGASGAYVVHSYGLTGASANTEGLSIDVAGAVSVEGLNTSVDGLITRGLLGIHRGWGSATVRTRAAAEVAAPFAVGMEGRLTNDASAAGRIVVTHEGAVEARDVGVLAWAARSSGLTGLVGARTADDAARTAPMIHVTSSGDITVGASVTDAFIRNRIAGADETLSTGEQAVLSEIVAGDSDGLTKALAALSDDDYDAAWKAEAQNLLRKRAASSAAPTGDGPAAQRAAEEILGLSRAGVRASALSHTAIADHVRAGDALSDAERAALEAVLTKGAGSELETALSALTGAAYTTVWKNAVRRLAATYNAGDIRVDVTGGAIAAEGNGVEALYAVPHDSNGAIAVTVAEGARVTGGANGIYVRGGGAGEGSLRAQSVTVNGRVTGGTGTGAGVRMIDGGRLTVGKTGRIGATSGVGVLSDGAGDLHATVAGTVEGDVQIRGGGALRLNVREGGAVTGTVRDPVGLSTVVGSIGRLLYSGGATVTVARTGSLTGVEVEGGTEALRSEAGDLDLTVAGTVTGDVRALGAGDLDATISGTVTGDVLGLGAGEHTVTVSDGGTVKGAIHLAASTVTVAGTAGQVRFDNEGMVTVTRTGRLTGIEGVAVRNAGGALRVVSAGRIEGDVVDVGERPATVTVEAGGTVTGSIDLSAEGSEVTVTGTAGRVRLDGGGMVVVGPNSRISGIEDQAITSARGELGVEIRQAPGETTEQVRDRIRGAIRAAGALEVRYVSADGSSIDLSEPGRSAPVGAFDVGVVADGDGVRLDHELAPRSKVYEALPSVLLGLNRLPEFRDRMAAPRTADGAGWARVETFRGKWKADESTTPGLEYDHRRHGLKAGVDAAVGGHGLFGVSLHHRRGTAEVSAGGDVELSGHGVGMSGTAWLVDDVYVDVQAEATWYEADLSATGRGVLKTGVPGRGHALGVEVGRRVALERLPAGVVLTPRAGLAHSRVSMGGFTDAVGARVSVEDGRSLKGRAGMAVEMEPGGASGSRVFGSVDVEHEFSRDTKVVVSGTELRSEAEATWLRLGLNGVHAWDEGRYTVQGGVSYATGGGGHELGGGVSLSLRF